jgi:hypothetical protein
LYGTPHTITIASGNVPNPTQGTANAGDSIIFMNTDRLSTKLVRYASDKTASKFHPFALIIPPDAQVEILAVASGNTSKQNTVNYTVDSLLDSGRLKKKRRKKRRKALERDDTYQVIVNS